MRDAWSFCVLTIGHVIDGDEAGNKGKALNDQRHWIVEEAVNRQAENAAFYEEEQQEGPDDH